MIVAPTDIPRLVKAVETAVRKSEPLGPAIDDFINRESLPWRLRDPRKFSNAVGINFSFWNDKPTYQRLPLDRIMMPPRHLFNDMNDWRSCLFHEFGHFLEWRTGWRGTSARGELRAEVVQAVLETLTGLPHSEDFTNYAKFNADWILDFDANPGEARDSISSAIEAAEMLVKYACEDRIRTPEQMETEAALVALIEKANRRFAG